MNKLAYADARRIRLEGRKAAWDGQARLSRFRDLGPAFHEYDKAFLLGYEEVAAAPHIAWFQPNGMPWRCGQRTKAGSPCRRDVDRKGSRCPAHREKARPVQLDMWAA